MCLDISDFVLKTSAHSSQANDCGPVEAEVETPAMEAGAGELGITMAGVACLCF